MAIKDNIDDDRYRPLELPAVPKNVVRFARLFYLSLWLAVPIFFLQWSTYGDSEAQTKVALGLLFALIFFPIFIWLIHSVARRRRNWARWILLLCFIVGTPGWFSMVWAHLKISPAFALFEMAQFALQVAAFFLIFSKSANEWLATSAVADASR